MYVQRIVIKRQIQPLNFSEIDSDFTVLAVTVYMRKALINGS